MSRGRPTVRVSEKGEQAHIVRLLRTLGATVYVLGTVRRRADAHHGTMQTPGLPDLLAFLPDRRPATFSTLLRQVWIEVKTATGRLSPEQADFAIRCRHAGLDYVSGPLDAVIAWLTREGYLTAEQGPHYRRPTTTAEAGP